jgi:hypothetical protein
MSWWAVPIVGVLGVLGLLAGWAIGAFLIALRDEPYDIWEDWED